MDKPSRLFYLETPFGAQTASGIGIFADIKNLRHKYRLACRKIIRILRRIPAPHNFCPLVSRAVKALADTPEAVAFLHCIFQHPVACEFDIVFWFSPLRQLMNYRKSVPSFPPGLFLLFFLRQTVCYRKPAVFHLFFRPALKLLRLRIPEQISGRGILFLHRFLAVHMNRRTNPHICITVTVQVRISNRIRQLNAQGYPAFLQRFAALHIRHCHIVGLFHTKAIQEIVAKFRILFPGRCFFLRESLIFAFRQRTGSGNYEILPEIIYVIAIENFFFPIIFRK